MPNYPFRTEFAETIANNKQYLHEGCETWDDLAQTLTFAVTERHQPLVDQVATVEAIADMQFIPGGRYLYYAGRDNPFYNNCYLLKAEEDTREDWARLSWKVESCLMTGGGIGVDYSVYRSAGSLIKRTGGRASGPIEKMKMVNEQGRYVRQGGSRRSAIYASLNWRHGDARAFLTCKDWYAMPIAGAFEADGTPLTIGRAKELDFNYPAPLDMTNISLNYDNEFLEELYGMPFADLLAIYTAYGKKGVAQLPVVKLPATFVENVRQAMKTGEPGLSFNFFEKVLETLRNACCEVTSEDDSDVCNLGSLNLSRIKTKEEFRRLVRLGSRFLVCGTLEAKLPYSQVYETRQKNRRLGLGLMGVHEWLLQRGYRYEMVDELREWMEIYRDESERAANELCDLLGISRPVAYRAIAPTGTIGIMAGTTTGLEPLFAVAYMRRYLDGNTWKYQYVVDGTAKLLIEELGIDPDLIETALDLAKDPERRIKFQADVQDYVDMAISSTINIEAWGTEYNNEARVEEFAGILAKYAVRLRGFTCYPDGSRGGQPLTAVSYREAKALEGQVFEEQFFDICDISKGGTCGS